MGAQMPCGAYFILALTTGKLWRQISKSLLRVRSQVDGDARQVRGQQHKGWIGPIGIGATAGAGRGTDQQIQLTQQLQLATDMGLGHPQQQHQLLDSQGAIDRQAEDAQAGGRTQSSEQPRNWLGPGHQEFSDSRFHGAWMILKTIRTSPQAFPLWVFVPIPP